MARGRVVDARFLAATSGTLPDPDDVADELILFERARQLYRDLGDLRGEAETQFWIGTFPQVVRHDDVVAVPALERDRALATQADDPLTLSYARRHLGIARHRAGELEEARSYLEESTRLRRQLGFGAGVAANLVGLAYLAAGSERRDEVPRAETRGLVLTSYNLGLRLGTSDDVRARWQREVRRRFPGGLDNRLVLSFGVNDTTGRPGGTRTGPE